MKEFAKELFDFIHGPLKGLNLTNYKTFNDFYRLQIEDAIVAYEQSEFLANDLRQSEVVTDFGFGGGFPLFPLAKLVPNKKFIGIEARVKKVKAVNEIAKELSVNNVEAFHYRIEEIYFNKQVVITSKAVGKLIDYLPKIKMNKNCVVYFFKGPKFFENEGKDIAKLPNWKFDIEEIKLPQTEGRILVRCQLKNANHLKSKDKSKNSKENILVNLSDLI